MHKVEKRLADYVDQMDNMLDALRQIKENFNRELDDLEDEMQEMACNLNNLLDDVEELVDEDN